MSKNILWHDRSSFEVDKKNPWRGLASYDDPQNNNTNYEFCGRDEEAAQIVRLVDNSLFVTLYGRTGVGKTSLLKAGVFPILRLHNYVPLYVRLAHGNKDKSYAEIVLNAIENCDELKEKRHNDAGLINTDGKSITFLWDFFCQTKFFNKEGQEVYPVIVLDQFEEIFVNQSPKEREKANLFLRQIYTLLSDDYILLDKEGFSDETNYRFIASIREDNLFLLEDSIDEESLSQYKEDRYRLRPMSKMQAIEAILQPGKDCIAEDEKEEIANKIIEAAKDKDGTISSLMLSFICSQLYEKAATSSASPLITIKIFNEHLSESKRLLTEFYLQQTSKKQRKIIEEYFLTEDGHRKQCQVPIPNSEDLVNKYKIMQDTKTENGDGLEIVHDKLAEVIYMHRRQTDSKKFRYALCCVVGLIMVALFGLSIILSWSSSMPYDKKSILAINKKPKSYPKTDTLINDRIVDISLKNSDIRNVLIGDNVDSISSISLSEEQRIVVSTKNNMIKSDYIYRCGSYKADTIQYLYYADQPQVAIWAQKYIYYGDSLRFPKGIKEIKIDGSYRRASEYAPYYGEQNIVINTENDFNYVKNDKRIQSVTIRNVSEVPERQFEGCINLTRADLSGDEMKLNSSCFKGCVNLREVILPKKLSGNYSSEEFYGCVNLEKIVLPDQVEYPGGLGQMFQWCPNIKEISYYSENTNFKEHEDGIIYYHSEYDTIPVFFYNCKEANWGEGEKGGYWIVDARVMYNANQINIIQSF